MHNTIVALGTLSTESTKRQDFWRNVTQLVHLCRLEIHTKGMDQL